MRLWAGYCLRRGENALKDTNGATDKTEIGAVLKRETVKLLLH